MAENESLDLWNRNSGRWRRFLQSCEMHLQGKRPAGSVARDAVECLYRVSKNLVELPLNDFFCAARETGAAASVVLRKCRRHRDYAELFAHFSHIHADPVRLVEAVLNATIQRYFDQIAMKLGPDCWANMARCKLSAETLMRHDVSRLAKQILTHPTERPRMPRRSIDQKLEDEKDLLHLSLKLRPSGTHA